MTDFSFVENLPETIFTGRLILRAPALQDAEPLTRLANNEKIYKMLARLPHPYEQKHAIDFIENGARASDEHAFAILTRDEIFIGTIGFHLVAAKPAEIGYWLGEPYWGEGYASEAASALVTAADEAGCGMLAATARSENLASCRVLLKTGFVKNGERIDACGVHQSISITQFRRERLR